MTKVFDDCLCLIISADTPPFVRWSDVSDDASRQIGERVGASILEVRATDAGLAVDLQKAEVLAQLGHVGDRCPVEPLLHKLRIAFEQLAIGAALSAHVLDFEDFEQRLQGSGSIAPSGALQDVKSTRYPRAFDGPFLRLGHSLPSPALRSGSGPQRLQTRLSVFMAQRGHRGPLVEGTNRRGG